MNREDDYNNEHNAIFVAAQCNIVEKQKATHIFQNIKVKPNLKYSSRAIILLINMWCLGVDGLSFEMLLHVKT